MSSGDYEASMGERRAPTAEDQADTTRQKMLEADRARLRVELTVREREQAKDELSKEFDIKWGDYFPRGLIDERAMNNRRALDLLRLNAQLAALAQDRDQLIRKVEITTAERETAIKISNRRGDLLDGRVKCSDCVHYWARKGQCAKSGRGWSEPDTCAPPWCPGFKLRPEVGCSLRRNTDGTYGAHIFVNDAACKCGVTQVQIICPDCQHPYVEHQNSTCPVGPSELFSNFPPGETSQSPVQPAVARDDAREEALIALAERMTMAGTPHMAWGRKLQNILQGRPADEPASRTGRLGSIADVAKEGAGDPHITVEDAAEAREMINTIRTMRANQLPDGLGPRWTRGGVSNARFMLVGHFTLEQALTIHALKLDCEHRFLGHFDNTPSDFRAGHSGGYVCTECMRAYWDGSPEVEAYQKQRTDAAAPQDDAEEDDDV